MENRGTAVYCPLSRQDGEEQWQHVVAGVAVGGSLSGATHREVLRQRTGGVARYNAVTALHADDRTGACELENWNVSPGSRMLSINRGERVNLLGVESGLVDLGVGDRRVATGARG